MSYLDESGLSIYDSNLKEWISSQDSKTITSSIYPWIKTAKAGVVSCYPVGGTELKPTVDFLFTEVPPASGDKGPSNPSTITGVSSVKVTRAGKNLCPLRDSEFVSQYGVTFTPLSDGGYRLHGTTNGTNTCHCTLNGGYFWPYKNGATYRVNLFCSTTNIRVIFQAFNSNGTIRFTRTANDGGGTFTNITGDELLNVRISVDKAAGEVDLVVYPQIELGSVTSEFEKPESTDYTLPLGSTYYGGTLDAATGVMTATQVAYELDSSFSWNTTAATYAYRTVKSPAVPIVAQNIDLFKSSHFILSTATTVDMPVNTFFARADGNIIVSTNELSMQAFKDWLDAQKLAGTPVVVTYPLYTPYTVTLTPTEILSLAQTDKYTPRLNTVYTDAQSVQVGYVKSPIREEQELTQAIVAQGGNI